MRRFSWMVGIVVWASLISGAGAAPVVGKAPVAAALARLEGWLAVGPHAAAWGDYLQLDLLRQEIERSEGADLDVLETTLRRLATNQPGLDLPPFLELRTALEGWLARATLPEGARLKAVTDSLLRRVAAGAATTESHRSLILVAEQRPIEEALRAQQEFGNRLTALRVLLSAYAQDPAPWLADEIGATLDWLSSTGKAEPVVAAVRDYYGHPNLWIDVSERTLAGGVEGAIERTIVVEDSILGTDVRGHGTTKATKSLIFAPHAERAVLRLRVSGTIDTMTLGRNGPARIHGRARTTFRAEKDFWLTADGLRALPADCTAETTTLSANIQSASPGVRGRIVKRVAQRQVRQQQAEADQIAARHAEDEIRDLVDQEASELVSQIDRCAIAPLLELAKDTGGSVRLHFCSGEGLLRIGAVVGPLGAPPGEPNLPLDSGLALRWHSTLGERWMESPLVKTFMASLQPSNPLTERLGAIVPANFVRTAGAWSQQLVQAAGSSPAEPETSPLSSSSLLSGKRLEEALERWLNQTFDPEITARGIALRGGRLGTVAPGGPGSDWLSVAWSTPEHPTRLARQQ